MLRTRILNTQSQYAAIVIQRYVRGHQRRRQLWSWHGVLTRSRALKIQRVFRGFRDRNYVRYLLKIRQHHHANKIIGLFHGWKARRLVAILKAEFVWNCVVKIQKMFRGMIGRDRFAAYRFKVHTEKARVLQRVGRGYMGRRRAKGLRIRMRHVMASIRSVLQQDSDVAMSFKRITIETYSQPGADEWTLFHLCMCHLLGTQRLEIAVDLAILLCNKAPNFGPAKFAYLCCLLSAWPDVGKAHVVREDWLEEALFLLLQLREKGKGFNLLGSLATEVTPHRQGGILSQHLSLDMLPVTVSTPAGLADRDAGFRPRDSPSTTSLSRRPSESSASRLVSLGWTLDGGDSEVPISLDMTVSDADDETFTTRGREYSFRTAGRDGGIYIPVSSFDGLDFNGEAWHSQASHIEVDIESSTSSICADGSIAYNEYEEYPHKALESEKALGGVVSSIVGRRDGEVAAVDDVPQPPWMNSIDPVAVFFDGIIEEIEYMFFRNCLVRYDKNLANLIQMSACVFAVNAPTLGDGSSGDLAVVRVPTRDGQRTPTGELETELRVMDMRGRGAGIGRARRLLNRASKLVGQVDAESMTYRMQVLENIFEAQHKEIFRQRKQLKDVSAGVFEARYICEYLKAVHEIEFEEFDSLELDAKAESNIVKIAASKGSKLKSTEGKKVADTKDKYKSNENKDQRMLEVFKVSADIVCYRCGEAMMVTAQLVVVGAHNNKPIATGTPKSTPHIPKQPTVAEKKNQEPVYQIYGTKGDKWLNNMVARPLVLLPHEVEAMHEQAIPFFCQALSQDEGSVRMRGRWKNIAEYIMQFIRVVSCGVQQSYSKTSIFEPHLSNAMRASKSDLYRPTQDTPISSDVESFAKEAPRSSFPTSRVRVCLPMIEYRRRERNSVRVESTAIVLLQRAYRGFRSRALKRRLKARLFEDMRQSNRDRDQVTALAKVRRRRYLMAALIQSIMRGYLWRKELRKMKVMALVIQCAFRIHKAVEKVEDERRRRSKGPPVVEMIRKTMIISDVPLLMVGYRCNANYKFVGYDFQNQVEYVCFVYQPEAVAFIETYNSQIEGPRTGPRASKKLLSTWRHKQLMEALIESLSITNRAPSATVEFGAKQYLTQKVLVLLKNAKGKNISDRSGQKRMLLDTKECVPQTILEGLLMKSAKIHF